MLPGTDEWSCGGEVSLSPHRLALIRWVVDLALIGVRESSFQDRNAPEDSPGSGIEKSLNKQQRSRGDHSADRHQRVLRGWAWWVVDVRAHGLVLEWAWDASVQAGTTSCVHGTHPHPRHHSHKGAPHRRRTQHLTINPKTPRYTTTRDLTHEHLKNAPYGTAKTDSSNRRRGSTLLENRVWDVDYAVGELGFRNELCGRSRGIHRVWLTTTG